jgi:hypothetical protein
MPSFWPCSTFETAPVLVRAPAPSAGVRVLVRVEPGHGEHTGGEQVAGPSLDGADAHGEAFGEMLL